MDHHVESHDSFEPIAHEGGASGWRQSLAILAVVLITAGLAAAVAAPGAIAADGGVARTAAVQRCGKLSFEYPGGGGGASASSIFAQGMGCRAARRVVRQCLHGRRADGWSFRFSGSRVTLRSGGRKIVYAAAGGGGCP